MDFHDVIGLLGVLLYLVSFFMLQIERLRFDDYSYLAINIVAAILIMASLYEQFNLSAFLIEVVWAMISIMGVVRRIHRDRRSIISRC